MNKWLFGGLVLVALLWCAPQAHAQTSHPRTFARNTKAVSSKSYQPRRGHHQHLQAWKNRWFHHNELPPLRPDDGCGRYPKYYGGFHVSHFERLGIPHGDYGFRGPSIYWTPW